MSKVIDKISQSFYREFTNPDSCNLACRFQFVDDRRKPTSAPMKLGLAFESLVLGASREGDYSNDYPKTKGRTLKDGTVKDQKPTEDSVKMLAQVDTAKKIMTTVFPDWIEVQPAWECEGLSGHPDLIASCLDSSSGEFIPRAIIDLKYITSSKLSQTRWSYYNWDDPMNNDNRQAVQYVAMNYILTGEIVPFYYAAFSAGGWNKIIRINVPKSIVEEHIKNIDEVRFQVKTEGFTRNHNDFNKCNKCFYKNDCGRQVKEVTIESFEMEELLPEFYHKIKF